MSRPLGSTPTPASRASQLLRAGPPANAASVLSAFGFCLGTLPLAAAGPTTPAAVSTLAFSRSVQEPQTRLTPPLRRAPPGQYTGTRQAHPEGTTGPPILMPSEIVTTPQQRHPPGPPGRALLARLPDPHLTRSRRAFSLSLTTTVFSQRSTGWFSACPRRPTLEGQQSSISRTAPLMKESPT